MSEGSFSQIRKIKLFFPPIESPLLTTFGKSVMWKVQPLKEKFAALSQRTQSQIKPNPESIYMSSLDIDIVNTSYAKIKRSRGESLPAKQTDFVKDPLYKSIYDMKHKSVMHVRAKSKRNMLKFSAE